MLLAFLPFITFAVLDQRMGPSFALFAAALVSAILVVREVFVRRKSVKILEVGSLILFGALAVASLFPQFKLSILAVRLWVDAGLFVIVAGSIVFGRPFTLQYAREQVSPEIASTERFRNTTMRIALAWAAAFAVIVAADAAMIYVSGFNTRIGTVVIVAALGAAVWFTSWAPKAAARGA